MLLVYEILAEIFSYSGLYKPLYNPFGQHDHFANRKLKFELTEVDKVKNISGTINIGELVYLMFVYT